jgi:chromosome segregation ATPase
MRDLQIAKDAVIEQLRVDQKRLEEQNEKVLVELEARGDHVKELEERASSNSQELKKLETRVNEAQNRVKVLEAEIARKNAMVEQRDQTIKEQGHQIADL